MAEIEIAEVLEFFVDRLGDLERGKQNALAQANRNSVKLTEQREAFAVEFQKLKRVDGDTTRLLDVFRWLGFADQPWGESEATRAEFFAEVVIPRLQVLTQLERDIPNPSKKWRAYNLASETQIKPTDQTFTVVGPGNVRIAEFYRLEDAEIACGRAGRVKQ